MIKPEFFVDDKVGELTVTARLLFVGLWCLADKRGRLEDIPKKIKVQIFPYDNIPCEKFLEEIEKLKMITRYILNDKKYIQINNFNKHQHPHHTEAESIIPESNSETTVKQPLIDGECPANTDTDTFKLPCANSLRESFETFWKNYPKKRSKGQAEKAWLSLKPDEQFVAKILQGIERAKTSESWRKDGGQFIPYPATWLRAKGWEDDLKPVQLQSQRQSTCKVCGAPATSQIGRDNFCAKHFNTYFSGSKEEANYA